MTEIRRAGAVATGRKRVDKTSLKAIWGSCGDGCKEIKDNSVDLAIFSPPYKVKDGWGFTLMQALGNTLFRVLKPGARAYMVFGQLKEGFARPWESVDAIAYSSSGEAIKAKSSPLEKVQTIIWAKSLAMPSRERLIQDYLDSLDKGEDPDPRVLKAILKEKPELLQAGHYQPINSPDVLNYGFEYVFGLRKPGPARALDRLGIGVPFADKTNLTRGTRGQNGDLHCAGDVWFIPYETVGQTDKKHHRHQFPSELARRLIVLNQLEKGSLIFDPFLGGGTTAVAARMSGMNCVGYELNQYTIEVAKQRFKEHKDQRWRLAGAKL